MSRTISQMIHDHVDTALRADGLIDICVLSDHLLGVCDDLTHSDIEAAVAKASIDAGGAVAWERHSGEQP